MKRRKNQMLSSSAGAPEKQLDGDHICDAVGDLLMSVASFSLLLLLLPAHVYFIKIFFSLALPLSLSA